MILDPTASTILAGLSALAGMVAWCLRFLLAGRERDELMQQERDWYRTNHAPRSLIQSSPLYPIEPLQPWPRPAPVSRVVSGDTFTVYASGKAGGTGNGTAWLIKSGALARMPIAAIPPVLQGSRWVNAIVVSDAYPENTGVGITATRKAYRAPALPRAASDRAVVDTLLPARRNNPALSNPIEL